MNPPLGQPHHGAEAVVSGGQIVNEGEVEAPAPHTYVEATLGDEGRLVSMLLNKLSRKEFINFEKSLKRELSAQWVIAWGEGGET